MVQKSNMSVEDPRKNTDRNFEVQSEENVFHFHIFHQKSNGLA